MDKETLSHYGWIVVLVLVLSVLLAMATPFGKYIANAVENTTQGLFNTEQKALDAANIEQMENEWDDYLNGEDCSGGTGTETPSEPTPTECQHTNTTTINASSATCTVVGYTGDTYCNDCQTTTATGTAVSATGHQNTTIINASAAYTGDTYCNDCKTTIATGEIIPNNAVSELEPGLYQTGTTTLLYSWDELISLGAIVNNGGTISAPYEFDGDDYIWVIDMDGDLVLPYDGSVTGIGDSAFYGCQQISNITIPDSVINIGNAAFHGCMGLSSITIPDSVTSIGFMAFTKCGGLTSITIPDSVTYIGHSAFGYCQNLQSVVLSKNITEIGDSVFADCTVLTNLSIPSGVSSIGNYVFKDCTSLTNITFNGTIMQWQSITFGTSWSYRMSITKVICSDGEVTL